MAHAHDASENNPIKEIVHALIGIVLLLVIIGGIAVFAWLRPAGNHEPATVSATPAGRALDEFTQKEAKSTATQNTETVAEATAEAPSDVTADSSSDENKTTSEATVAEAEPKAEEAPAQ